METTNRSTSLSNGLTFGLIAGLVYCISLYIRYSGTGTNVILFAVLSLLFYLVVLGVLVFCGLTRKKQLGGYMDLKQAFQTIFIAILVAELIYTLFNFIYLKYIDPGYLDRMKDNWEKFFEGSGMNESQKEKQIERMEKQIAKQKDAGIGGIVQGYLIGVAITGVFGFIISLIIRKKKPVFDNVA
jgi:hypothetical protein